MSNHPRRYYSTNELQFIQLLSSAILAGGAREEVRRRYGFVAMGYVVMPDHIHLPISGFVRVMQAVKQGFARRVLKSLCKRRVARVPHSSRALFAREVGNTQSSPKRCKSFHTLRTGEIDVQ